jgi:uncharacterized UPF0160 family protein
MKALKVFEKIPENVKCKIIGTHSGKFHCDEALAIAMLSKTKEFGDAIVVRSRNPEIHKKCDILVDVGGEYDPSRHRYDHHQRTFTTTLSELGFKTKLSSAGLIYKHFGRDLIRDRVKDEKLIEPIYTRVYKYFVEHIDAIDNGVNISDGEIKYKIIMDLSSRVGRLNPEWNATYTDAEVNAQFEKAQVLTGTEFFDAIDSYVKYWIPARAIVEEAIKQRSSVDAIGEIVLLKQSCPWKEHLMEIESELGIEGKIKYVLFQSNDDGKINWRIQCVPISESSFTNRLSLPKEWQGLRDEELSKVSGIDGCIFVHATGFIGGNRTLEGALQMARKALQQPH